MYQLADCNTGQKGLQNEQNIVWEQRTAGYLWLTPENQTLPTQFDQLEVLSDSIQVTNNGGQWEKAKNWDEA